jgi:hypothetical protein
VVERMREFIDAQALVAARMREHVMTSGQRARGDAPAARDD